MFGYIVNDFIFSINEADISVNYEDEFTNDFLINESLKQYLCEIKSEIDCVQERWDVVKKFTNKYEYINTTVIFDSLGTKASVCSYKPISRSYFKMIEILKNFQFNFKDNITSFHLAEGPGGFVEALYKFRGNENDTYNAMTLMEEHVDIPKWNKISNILNKTKTIQLLTGPKGDGNLYFKHNLEYIRTTFPNKMDFITADGGFDYSVDFSRQEENSINLIFCEVLYALLMQKQGGSFVLKIFDAFHRNTLEILSLLAYFYKKVYIYKPQTSREANSEKYVICIDFQNKKNYHEIMDKLVLGFQDLNKQKLTRIFKYDMNNFYLNKIQEVNAIYGQQQIENILCTVNLVREFPQSNNKDKLSKIKNSNIEKCKKWCKEYDQPIHKLFTTTTKGIS